MNITCTEQGGKCFCQDNISGDKCDECSAEHYGFPSCQSIHSFKLEMYIFYIKNKFFKDIFQIIYYFQIVTAMLMDQLIISVTILDNVFVMIM